MYKCYAICVSCSTLWGKLSPLTRSERHSGPSLTLAVHRVLLVEWKEKVWFKNMLPKQNYLLPSDDSEVCDCMSACRRPTYVQCMAYKPGFHGGCQLQYVGQTAKAVVFYHKFTLYLTPVCCKYYSKYIPIMINLFSFLETESRAGHSTEFASL